MRADRLVAVLLMLQARGRVTAAEVAAELEVSVATARRDLEALSTAGIPVYAQRGHQGGWSLVGGARTDLSGLTAGEARALFLLVGPAASVAPEACSALRKLVQALPAPFRAASQAAADAVVIDPASWGRTRRDRPAALDPLQDAVVRRRRVRFAYRGRSGLSTRTADPWGLVDKDGTWYLVAGTEAGRRTFRLDRVESVDVTDDAADRPDDVDLASAWGEIASDVERLRSEVAVVVVVPARLAAVVAGMFGRHAAVVSDSGDRTRLRVASHTARSVAEHLAGFGAAVEVEPDDAHAAAVRGELAAIGAELVRRHG